MHLADLTLIVPTKDERRNIASFLGSIPQEITLIIVDASHDGTEEIVRMERPRNTLIIRQLSNIPEARQTGADYAVSDWLLFSDADVVFDPEYFQNLTRMEIAEITGVLAGAKGSIGRHGIYYRFFSFGLGLLCSLGVGTATGSNMLVRKSALLQAGGFEKDLPCNEDSLLAWRISRLGYKVEFKGSLRVYERDHRRLDRGVLKKTFHSLFRCFLLFAGLYPRVWYRKDWGYWEEKPEN